MKSFKRSQGRPQEQGTHPLARVPPCSSLRDRIAERKRTKPNPQPRNNKGRCNSKRCVCICKKTWLTRLFSHQVKHLAPLLTRWKEKKHPPIFIPTKMQLANMPTSARQRFHSLKSQTIHIRKHIHLTALLYSRKITVLRE